MRLTNHALRVRCNGGLRIEFIEQRLWSFSGLELVRRYFRRIDLKGRIQSAFRGVALGGDYRVVDLVMVLLTLWLVGGRRIRQIGFLAEDPLVQLAQAAFLDVIHDHDAAKSLSPDWLTAVRQSLNIAVRVDQYPVEAAKIVDAVLTMKEAPASVLEDAGPSPILILDRVPAHGTMEKCA